MNKAHGDGSLVFDIEHRRTVPVCLWQEEAGEERTIAIARKMLRLGRPIAEIVEDTGLTFGEIQQPSEGD